MTPQQALEVLKQHQEWKNKEDFYLKPYTYKQLQEALTIAIEVMEGKTIPIERIEEIIISTAPAPAKLNQIANLIEKYKS